MGGGAKVECESGVRSKNARQSKCANAKHLYFYVAYAHVVSSKINVR